MAIELDRVDPELSLDLVTAVLYRARQDARRDPEAKRFLAAVANRCLAETGGCRISTADVVWATLAVMWDGSQAEA
jgi:hypothetical protein